MSEPSRTRGVRRRRPSPARIAFQLVVGAIAYWAITHPHSPLQPAGAIAPDDGAAPDSAPSDGAAPGAATGAGVPTGAPPAPGAPGDTTRPLAGAPATAPGAPLAPPAAAPLGAGGTPISPLAVEEDGRRPARERLAGGTRPRPWWLGGRDADSAGTRRRFALPRLREVRLFRSVEERARLGERIAVTITAYCLQGRTRRGNPVREGIVASDPRLFPLGRRLELWIGRRAAGEFLIDDTGSAIKGAKLDLWMADCGDARRFGRRRGYAQLLPRDGGRAR